MPFTQVNSTFVLAAKRYNKEFERDPYSEMDVEKVVVTAFGKDKKIEWDEFTAAVAKHRRARGRAR